MPKLGELLEVEVVTKPRGQPSDCL
jgi:hypothetical protein